MKTFEGRLVMQKGNDELSKVRSELEQAKNQNDNDFALVNYKRAWKMLPHVHEIDAISLKEECLKGFVKCYNKAGKESKAKSFEGKLKALQTEEFATLQLVKIHLKNGTKQLKGKEYDYAAVSFGKKAWPILKPLPNVGQGLILKQRCLTGLVNTYTCLGKEEKASFYNAMLKDLETSTDLSLKGEGKSLQGSKKEDDVMMKTQQCFAPFVSTLHLVCAYHLAQDNGDKVAFNAIKGIVAKDIVPEITLDKVTITQGLVLLGCADEEITNLVLNQLSQHIRENPSNFQHIFDVLEVGMSRVDGAIHIGNSVKIQQVLLEKMNSLYAPDLAVTAALLNSMYQTLVVVISPPNFVKNIDKILHIKPLQATLRNLTKRLGKSSKDDDIPMQTIKAAVSYANDTLAQLETNKTPWQKRVHAARIMSELLLHAMGVSELAAGAVASDGITAGSALVSGFRFFRSVWSRGKKIYRYYKARQPYFEALKDWQEHLVEHVLSNETAWETYFNQLQSQEGKMDWLLDPAAQIALLRVLMAIYPVKPAGITVAQYTILKTYIVDYFMHIYQVTTVPQGDDAKRKEAEYVKQTVANCMLRLSESQLLPNGWDNNQLVNITEKNQTIYRQQTTRLAAPILSDTLVNIAERGWQKQYADDINLYCYLQGYQSAKPEHKPDFLMAIARYTHPAHKHKARLSFWGETVLGLIPAELLKVTRQNTPSTFKPGTFKTSAMTMILGGEIRGDAAYIKVASEIQNESADKHNKRLNDIVGDYGLFDRWETLIAKLDFKRWLDDGITIEADYLRGDHLVSFIQENSVASDRNFDVGKVEGVPANRLVSHTPTSSSLSQTLSLAAFKTAVYQHIEAEAAKLTQANQVIDVVLSDLGYVSKAAIGQNDTNRIGLEALPTILDSLKEALAKKQGLSVDTTLLKKTLDYKLSQPGVLAQTLEASILQGDVVLGDKYEPHITVQMIEQAANFNEAAVSELWENWQSAMIAYYTEETFVNKRLFDRDYFSLTDYFVNLQVVVNTDRQETSFSSDQDNDSYKPLRERDRLEGNKKAIDDLAQLFDANTYEDANESQPNEIMTVLVSGAAGVGKTTLSDYIAYQWARFKQGERKIGLWSTFDMILIIRCRYLHEKIFNPDWTDVDLLRFACLGGLSVSADEMQHILRHMSKIPEKCLLLFDGLDELPEIKRESMAGRLLTRLFNLAFKKIVTTRPYAVNNLCQWTKHQGLAEITGFKDDNISTYFKKVLKSKDDKPETFIKALKGNQNTWEMAHIPINAYLLKRWWKLSINKQDTSVLAHLSRSDLYTALMMDLFRVWRDKKYGLKKAELLLNNNIFNNKEYKRVMMILGQWAFEGLVRNTTDLALDWLDGVTPKQSDYKLMKKCELADDDMELLEQSGLIKQISKLDSNDLQYCFLHLSFQEFLAANVIAEHLRKEAEREKMQISQVIHMYKYNLNFSLVWPLVAGLLKRYPKVLNDFLSLMIEGPREWVGIFEFDLLTRCLEASMSLNTEVALIGSYQHKLLQAVKLRLKKFNKFLKAWQEPALDTLSACPQIIKMNADAVLMLLRDQKISVGIRSKFAISAGQHCAQTPKYVDLIFTFLCDEEVSDYVRSVLAKNTGLHLSQALKYVSLILAFLRNDKVSGDVRCELAIGTSSHLSKIPEYVNEVLKLLRNDKVSGDVRCELAIGTSSHLSKIPEYVNEVLKLLQDNKIRHHIRGKLAASAGPHCIQTPKSIDAVWVLLQDDEVNEIVRSKLAGSAGAHLPQVPEMADRILELLRDNKIGDDIRCELAASASPHCIQTPKSIDAVWVLLQDNQVNWTVRSKLAESASAHLPQVPEMADKILMLLRDEKVDWIVRRDLAQSTGSHCTQTFEAVVEVLKFLQDKTVDKTVRAALAISTGPYCIQTSETFNKVLRILRDKKMDGRIRCKLAASISLYCHQNQEFTDAVLILFRDEKVEKYACRDLAANAGAHLSQTPEVFDVLFTLLLDKRMDIQVRCNLARNAGSYLSKIPEYVDKVLKLLRDDEINYHVRCKLAASAGRHCAQTREAVDAVWMLFRNIKVELEIRLNLAKSIGPYLSRLPGTADAVLALCQDETYKSIGIILAKSIDSLDYLTSEDIDIALVNIQNQHINIFDRIAIAARVAKQLSRWPNKTKKLLDSLFFLDGKRRSILSLVDIPVYLLLPLYNKLDSNARYYTKLQLAKNHVLIYEQAGKVFVTQAGQTEKLTLPSSIIQQIQKDLQPYRKGPDNSGLTINPITESYVNRIYFHKEFRDFKW